MYKICIATILILSMSLMTCKRGKKSVNGNTNGGQSGTTGSWLDSITFIRIEAGEFTIGSPAGESERLGGPKQDDEEQVSVKISKSFEIMETEVTQKQWFEVMKVNPSHFKEPKHCTDHENGMCPNHPVDSVSWDDVHGYITELNKSLGLSGCNGKPDDKSGCYRLPTEAEWEYAVRGGGKNTIYTAYFFGDSDDTLGDYAWYWKNSGGGTHKVRTRNSSPNGLYDVYGNVWEWVQDKHSSTLPGGPDPLNESGSNHVVRGGGWGSRAWYLRSANRDRYAPNFRFKDIGFRLVRTL